MLSALSSDHEEKVFVLRKPNENLIGEKSMFIVAQILTLFFVLLSLGLVVTVPVALAVPGQWETSKDNIFKSATLWTSFVFLIALVNAFIK